MGIILPIDAETRSALDEIATSLPADLLENEQLRRLFDLITSDQPFGSDAFNLFRDLSTTDLPGIMNLYVRYLRLRVDFLEV